MFCSNCGLKQEANTNFCHNCGAKQHSTAIDTPDSATLTTEMLQDVNYISENVGKMTGQELARLSQAHPSTNHVYKCPTCQEFVELGMGWIGENICRSRSVSAEIQIKTLRETYTTLEADLSFSINAAIVENPNSSPEALDEVVDHVPFELYEELIAHPNLSQSGRELVEGW